MQIPARSPTRPLDPIWFFAQRGLEGVAASARVHEHLNTGRGLVGCFMLGQQTTTACTNPHPPDSAARTASAGARGRWCAHLRFVGAVGNNPTSMDTSPPNEGSAT